MPLNASPFPVKVSDYYFANLTFVLAGFRRKALPAFCSVMFQQTYSPIQLQPNPIVLPASVPPHLCKRHISLISYLITRNRFFGWQYLVVTTVTSLRFFKLQGNTLMVRLLIGVLQ